MLHVLQYFSGRTIWQVVPTKARCYGGGNPRSRCSSVKIELGMTPGSLKTVLKKRTLHVVHRAT